MAIVDLKANYVVRVSTSETFDPGKRVKTWVDKRATDPSNIDEDFIYTYYFRSGAGVEKARFLLNRSDAATPNVPPEGTKNTMGELPEPCRDLKPGEKVTGIDPFGRFIVEGPETILTLDAKIDEILKIVRAILAGG